MVLSIGMIVKNEEKYLRKCLEALSPILKQVNSELIIADTGSSDNTVKIAEEYTKNVFYFEWCNNFAAARNSVMKRAKGSWFMSIDADEILDDPNGIIKFFNSGEYKNYNSAFYTIRSANDANLKYGSDFNAPRLIKMKSDSRYVNAVHEHFERVHTPIKFLPVIANHYGYICENNDAFFKNKAKKYLDILLVELEKSPSDCAIYLNICNSYNIMDEYDKVLEYCDKGIACAEKHNVFSIKYSLYSLKIQMYVQLENYTKAIELCDDYFNSKQSVLGTDLVIYIFQAESFYSLKNYKEAITAYKKYLDFYIEFKKGMHNTPDTFEHSIAYTNEASYRFAILRLANSLYEEKNYTEARSYLQKIPAGDFSKDKNYSNAWLSLEIGLMEKENDFSKITDLYEQLEDSLKSKMQILIEKEINNDSYRDSIVKEFISYNSQSDYHRLLRLRCEYKKGDLTAESVQNLLNDIIEWTPVFADVVYFAAVTGLPLSSFVSEIDASDVGSFFFNNPFFHFKDFSIRIHEIYKNSTDTPDTYLKIWLSSFFLSELTSNSLAEENASELFIEYSKLSYDALTAQYKVEVLTDENAYLIPKVSRVGYYCYKAVSSNEKGQGSQYLKYLSTALKLNNDLKNIIKILVDEYNAALEKEKKRASEFDSYALKVKKAIINLISSGKTTEAADFLKAYEELCPNDTEIPELKKRIASVQA